MKAMLKSSIKVSGAMLATRTGTRQLKKRCAGALTVGNLSHTTQCSTSSEKWGNQSGSTK